MLQTIILQGDPLGLKELKITSIKTLCKFLTMGLALV